MKFGTLCRIEYYHGGDLKRKVQRAHTKDPHLGPGVVGSTNGPRRRQEPETSRFRGSASKATVTSRFVTSARLAPLTSGAHPAGMDTASPRSPASSSDAPGAPATEGTSPTSRSRRSRGPSVRERVCVPGPGNRQKDGVGGLKSGHTRAGPFSVLALRGRRRSGRLVRRDRYRSSAFPGRPIKCDGKPPSNHLRRPYSASAR